MLLATDSSATWQAPLSATALDELRQLMRLAVTSGSAQAANLSGAPVYGQAGVVQSGKHSYLSWFVGYRGSLAVAVLETGSTASAGGRGAWPGRFLEGAARLSRRGPPARAAPVGQQPSGCGTLATVTAGLIIIGRRVGS